MVDITIATDYAPNDILGVLNHGPIWVSVTNGYYFYINDAGQAVYTKTTDKGLTFQSPVVLKTADFIIGFAVWADWQTPGGTGNLIHMAITSNNPDTTTYRSLDHRTDTLTAAVIVESFTSGAGSGSLDTTITKTRGGNLNVFVRFVPGAGDHFHRRSIDGGLTWTTRASPGDAGDDYFFAFPGNEADNQDVYFIQWRTAAHDLRLKVYDDSANTIASTTVIDTGFVDSASAKGIGGFSDPRDNNVYIFAGNGFFVATGDVKGYRIANAGSITPLTDVISNVFLGGVQPSFAQDTNTIYVSYSRGDPATLQHVYYKSSIDSGITWSGEVQFSATLGGKGSLGSDILITSLLGGRWQPSWADLIPDDAQTNVDNSVELAGDIVPPIVPPAPIGSPTSPSPQPGLAGGALLYIAPDSRVHELITPHSPVGRFVVGFSGAGMPPFDYPTQRSPFQHGDTVKDFFARPRVIQMLIRENFCDRDDWWNGRTTLLDDLRPNRQLTSTASVPGVLRFIRTDGTIRDINVFIDAGPRFEPAEAGVWDEWSFQEILRFIAHNPIFFDPTQATLTFAIVLDTDLVFPITFPIQFGSGEVDLTSNITYTGSWEEFPIIVITGPLADFRLDNVTTGEFLALGSDIAPGRTVTIDLRSGFKTVTDDLGNNLIGSVTPDSDLGTFHIAADPEATNGVNVMRLRGNQPTGATSVVINFFTRYVGI